MTNQIEFPQNYNHKDAEAKWQKTWRENGVYEWCDDKPRAETYVIDTPPPTVSGILHMGHVFSYTQADFMARFKRMKGFDVFYPMGFDDNGLPTERLVEKVKKIRATDLPREKFIEECQSVVDEAEQEFEALFTSLALSVDWRQKYMTISEQSRKISQASFLDLFHKGHVERRHQPMFWDPVDQTAIATAEMEEKELDSFENYLYFGLTNKVGDDLGKVEIMTTRPEMLAACVALLHHESKAIPAGATHAITPLFGAKVPLLADDEVDPEKGTGFVMCCTFGDEQDIAWWRKHKLETKIILNKYGKLEVEGELQGKKAAEARKLIIELLEQGGHTANPKKPIKHMVKCAERSGAALEIIPTEQWFIKIVDKKEQILEKINECTWHPQYMKLRAEQWTENLSWDWCISRQRYFGVPFPVWYVQEVDNFVDLNWIGDEEIAVAELSTLPVNPLVDLPSGYEEYKSEGVGTLLQVLDKTGGVVKTGTIKYARKDGRCYKIQPDYDVMDTWATSSISPQLNSHFGINEDRHKKLFPADLRPQAHEIIRTWAFYTIVKALLHENTIPWKNLMISGWCLAEDKTKMSKSKGNVITPVPLIEEKSSDVVRYWASTSTLGADTAYSEEILKIGKKLVNKLWNACKFASLNLSKLQGEANGAKCTEVLDKWILTRLNKTIKNAEQEFEKYEYSKARQHIEDFFWNDFCDNYLELVKTRSYGENCSSEAQQSALNAISICIKNLLKLWAPFVPHIADELNSIIFGGESVHARGSWPQANLPEDEVAEKVGVATVEALEKVRGFKSENNVSIKFPVKQLTITSELDLSAAADDLKAVTSAANISFTKGDFAVVVELGEAEAA